MKNLNEKYLVIESYKGNENIVFAGTLRECNAFQEKARADIIKENGDDILTINDFYVALEEEYNSREERNKKLDEYKATLTEEELKEKVVVDGKTYMKWILDFYKIYKGGK